MKLAVMVIGAGESQTDRSVRAQEACRRTIRLHCGTESPLVPFVPIGWSKGLQRIEGTSLV